MKISTKELMSQTANFHAKPRGFMEKFFFFSLGRMKTSLPYPSPSTRGLQ